MQWFSQGTVTIDIYAVILCKVWNFEPQLLGICSHVIELVWFHDKNGHRAIPFDVLKQILCCVLKMKKPSAFYTQCTQDKTAINRFFNSENVISDNSKEYCSRKLPFLNLDFWREKEIMHNFLGICAILGNALWIENRCASRLKAVSAVKKSIHSIFSIYRFEENGEI